MGARKILTLLTPLLMVLAGILLTSKDAFRVSADGVEREVDEVFLVAGISSAVLAGVCFVILLTYPIWQADSGEKEDVDSESKEGQSLRAGTGDDDDGRTV